MALRLPYQPIGLFTVFRLEEEKMGKVVMLDPRVSVNLEDHPLAPGLDTLEGRVIGIVDNGQANSTPMFRELAVLLQEQYHPEEILFRTKPTHMQGAPGAMIDELAGRCDAIITGLGA
jgi:hypothetical protein